MAGKNRRVKVREGGTTNRRFVVPPENPLGFSEDFSKMGPSVVEKFDSGDEKSENFAPADFAISGVFREGTGVRGFGVGRKKPPGANEMCPWTGHLLLKHENVEWERSSLDLLALQGGYGGFEAR